MSTRTDSRIEHRRRFGGCRGQSMVEFSRAMWAYTTLVHATRQGARYAMVHGENNVVTTDQIIARVKSQAIGLDTSQITITPTYSPDNRVGSFVRVQATYPFSMVLGKLLFTSDRDGFQMRAASRMVVLN